MHSLIKLLIKNTEADAVFNKLKQLFIKRLVLAPYDKNGTLDLYTDASEVAIGAVRM